MRTKYLDVFHIERSGWLRLLGYGIAWKDITLYPLLFSERNGYEKTLLIGRWSFRWLNK